MAVRKSSRPTLTNLERRLAKVRVLIADRDPRTASLVNTVLRSFGFRTIELATDVDHVLEALQSKAFGLVITEWQLASSDGIHLVKSIRTPAKDHQVRRDIPIIMLTANSDVNAVKRARDAGITEFLAKPFSAATMSHRLIQVIDFPRSFIEAEQYVGPCRRRRGEPPKEEGERRGVRKAFIELPANRELADAIGKDIKAADIFTESLIKKAQEELQGQEHVFVQWASDDIGKLESAFAEIAKNPTSSAARDTILQAAYSIKSQAGIFGYDLGTQVAGSLVDYLEAHQRIGEDQLTVLHKHIETIRVVFTHKIKESGGSLGLELLANLHKLVKKLG